MSATHQMTYAGRGRRVCVAVVDSGWDLEIVDERVRPGLGLIGPNDDLAVTPSDVQDRIGHGTACADLVLRAAPQAEVLPLRVFGRRLETSPDVLIAGIEAAVEQGARVINLSLGTRRPDVRRPLYAACERAARRGVVIVAARNNAGSPSLPAAFDNVIGVGVGSFDGELDYEYRQCGDVDCLASGRQRDVRLLGGRRGDVTGTSFAAPIIAGTVARLLVDSPNADLGGIRRLLATAATRTVSFVKPSAAPS